jgi:hypothetical protein
MAIVSPRTRLRFPTPPVSRQRASERRLQGWRKPKPGRESRLQKVGASLWRRYADRGPHHGDPSAGKVRSFAPNRGLCRLLLTPMVGRRGVWIDSNS